MDFRFLGIALPVIHHPCTLFTDDPTRDNIAFRVCFAGVVHEDLRAINDVLLMVNIKSLTLLDPSKLTDMECITETGAIMSFGLNCWCSGACRSAVPGELKSAAAVDSGSESSEAVIGTSCTVVDVEKSCSRGEGLPNPCGSVQGDLACCRLCSKLYISLVPSCRGSK